jgi:hypothetical protein
MTQIRRYVKPNEGYGYWDDLTDWCVEQFGYPGHNTNWDYATEVNYMDFYFRNPQEAELFILKWM